MNSFAPGSIILCPFHVRAINHFAVVVNEISAIAYDGNEIRYEPITDEAKLHLTPRDEEHAAQIVSRAKSRLGEQEYSVVFNNCEHFATWCYNGDETLATSGQMAAAWGGGGAVVGVAVSTGGLFPFLVCAAAGGYVGHKVYGKIQEQWNQKLETVSDTLEPPRRQPLGTFMSEIRAMSCGGLVSDEAS